MDRKTCKKTQYPAALTTLSEVAQGEKANEMKNSIMRPKNIPMEEGFLGIAIDKWHIFYL